MKEMDKELSKLAAEIEAEAIQMRLDYENNPSGMSGSVVEIHENSPALDTEKDNDEPLYSGSRWTKVIKSF